MKAPAHGTAASPWTSVLTILALLLAAVLIIYRDTALAMVTIWSRSDTFAHAFTVPPIVAWLIWRKRHELAVQVPQANAWMLLPIGVAGMAWLIGDLAAANAVAQLAFTALLVLTVIAVIGPRASRSIAFPLAFLFFSVPVGEFMMPLMMEWTADFTVVALRLSGIPVYREGLQFIIPSGNWSVVEACSGIRYLIASTMVGVLFAYLNYTSLRRRVIFSCISIVVPILANWARAYLIVLVGHLSGNTIAVGIDHIIYGWLFFGLVITLMFMIGMRWSEPPAAPGMDRLPGPSAIQAPRNSLFYAVAAGVVVLFMLPHLALWFVARGDLPGTPDLVAPAELAEGWRVADKNVANWKPAFQGAAAEFNRTYAGNGAAAGQVGVYVGYYRHQDYEQKLVSSQNTAVTLHDEAWSVIDTGVRSATSGDSPVTFRTTHLRGSNHVASETSTKLMVWQVYWIDGTFIESETWAKVCIAFQRLMGRGDDAAVIVLYASDVDGGPVDAQLQQFVKANLPTLAAWLARTRSGGQAPQSARAFAEPRAKGSNS